LRARTKPWTDDLHYALRRADQLETEAARHRVNAAGHLARQLAGGKTRAELAADADRGVTQPSASIERVFYCLDG
jgi:hypothetical protein